MYRLAKDAGVGYPSVHGWLCGDRELSMKSASAIARALGLRLTKEA